MLVRSVSVRSKIHDTCKPEGKSSLEDQEMHRAYHRTSESSFWEKSLQIQLFCIRVEGNPKLISDLSELGIAWVWKLAPQCYCLTRKRHNFWLHPHVLSQRPWKENEKRPWEQETTFTSVWLNSGDLWPTRWACQREIQHIPAQSLSSGMAKWEMINEVTTKQQVGQCFWSQSGCVIGCESKCECVCASVCESIYEKKRETFSSLWPEAFIIQHNPDRTHSASTRVCMCAHIRGCKVVKKWKLHTKHCTVPWEHYIHQSLGAHADAQVRIWLIPDAILPTIFCPPFILWCS